MSQSTSEIDEIIENYTEKKEKASLLRKNTMILGNDYDKKITNEPSSQILEILTPETKKISKEQEAIIESPKAKNLRSSLQASSQAKQLEGAKLQGKLDFYNEGPINKDKKLEKLTPMVLFGQKVQTQKEK